MKFAPTKSMTFPLDGGLDLTTVHHAKKPGSLFFCNNLEMVSGRQGYGRPGGYERVTDDTTIPSDSTLWFFRIESATGAIAIDDLFASTTKTCRALNALSDPQDGDIVAVASHSTGWVVGDTCTGDTVSFDIQEVPLDDAGFTDTEIKAFRKAAVEQSRELVQEVPGTGTIAGGFRLRGSNYVFRDGVLYRGVSYDWEEVEMPEIMFFDEGIYEFAEGDVITDGVETATVTSITRQAGAWNYTLDAVDQSAGYITTTDASGSFTVGNNITVVPADIPTLLNGDFSADTTWAKGVGWTIADTATCDGTQTAESVLSQAYEATVGVSITITYTVSDRSAGGVAVFLGGSTGTSRTANGTYVETLTMAEGDELIGFKADADFVGKIDNVSISYSDFPAMTNGDFASDTIWIKETGWTITGGQALCSGSQTTDSRLYQTFNVEEDVCVAITFTVSNYSAGNVTVLLGLAEGTDVKANGTYTQVVTATAGCDKIGLICDLDFVGRIDNFTIAIGRRAKVKTVNTEYVLPATGSVKAKIYNFTNLANNDSAFGISGQAEAFEFDGTNYIPIYHPDAEDIWPFDISIHQERLQLVFPGGQLSNSISTQPRIFNPLLGAITYSTGSEITGLKKIHNNAEAIFTNDNIWLLLGTGIYNEETATRDWQFGQHDSSVGAIRGTVTEGGPPVFVGGSELRRIYSTDTTDKYSSEEVVEKVKPFLKQEVELSTVAGWSRTKSQYRLFFSDNKAIFYTFEKGQEKGGTIITYHIPILNYWSEFEGSKEYIFFTSNTGYLYRLDSGNSFDGEYIEGYFRLPFYNYKSPGIEKRFPQFIIDFEAPVILTNETTIRYTVDHSFGSILYPSPVFSEVTDIDGRGGVYGDNPGWGLVSWSGDVIGQIVAEPDGYGSNMSIYLTFSTRGDDSFTFMSATVDYQELGKACLG